MSVYRLIEAIIGRDLAWKSGRFLYLGARRELGNDPATNGEYALIEWLLDALVQRGDAVPLDARQHPVVLDVGASLGEWTAQAFSELRARLMMRRACIHAFEPAPRQNAHLQTRFAQAIALGQIRVHREAIGAQAAVARFSVVSAIAGTNALSAGGAPSGGDEIDVDVLTLDEAAERLGLDEILLVKVDTEGNDFNVIAGASRLLHEGRVMVLQFEYNWRWVGFGHCLRSVFALVANSSYAFGHLTQDVIEIHDEWHPELEHYFETNCVLVRRDVLGVLPHKRVVFGPSGTPRAA